MTALAAKKFLIVGGSGYLGTALSKGLVKLGANVTSLSRKGPRSQFAESAHINWVIGSIMNAEKHQKIINDADVIFHTVGALLDSSIKNFKDPGQQGTYEQMNRDSFLKLLSQVKSKKKIFYVSANGHPPFIHRYLTTKREAEQALLNTQHEGYVLRPGFIYSWSERKWSIPLKYGLDAYQSIYPHAQRFFDDKYPIMKKIVSELKVEEYTSLVDLLNSVYYLSMFQNPQRIIENHQMRQLSAKFHGYQHNHKL